VLSYTCIVECPERSSILAFITFKTVTCRARKHAVLGKPR
jgi:hypothetical protein